MERFFISLVIFILLVPLLFLLYFTIVKYRPLPEEQIDESEVSDVIPVDTTFHFCLWNIGYAGLNKEMDFFYEGGTMVRPSKETVYHNMDRMTAFLSKNTSCDFYLLQEVDVNSKRSYYLNEVEFLNDSLQLGNHYFALNYKVDFVPLPIREPMGKVEAGLLVLTNKKAFSCKRYSYPYNFKWPLCLFLLDRCFMTLRYKTDNGKELVVINTHNSAFDNEGKLRIAELNDLRDFMVKEYEKGNYVIAGGDFNQSPVGTKQYVEGEVFDVMDYIVIPDTLFPADWHYVYDNNHASNRRVDTVYVKGKTRVSLVDFFLTSPNIEVENVQCHDLGFENTDHNPVEMSVRLKK